MFGQCTRGYRSVPLILAGWGRAREDIPGLRYTWASERVHTVDRIRLIFTQPDLVRYTSTRSTMCVSCATGRIRPRFCETVAFRVSRGDGDARLFR